MAPAIAADDRPAGGKTKALVYVRAQVHDVDRGVVTLSDWIRWELR